MRKTLAAYVAATVIAITALAAAPTASATHTNRWPTYARVITNEPTFNKGSVSYFAITIRAEDWRGRHIKGHASLWVNGDFERRRELVWGWRGFRIDRGDLRDNAESRIQVRIDPSDERRRVKTVTEFVVDRKPVVSTIGQRVVAAARSQVGDRYAWGEDGPNAYDCSGLTKYAWATVGKRIPHSSWLQRSVGRRVYSPRPGDIVWVPGHVAIYAGNGRVIEAANVATGVIERRMWQRNPEFRRVAD